RADHQHAARNAPTEALELARIAQEFHQFADLFLGLVATGNVGEGGLDLILGKQARLGLAEAHGPALAARTALHLAHEEHEHRNDDQNREAGDQQLSPDALLLGLLAFDDHAVVDQVTDQTAILNRRTNGLESFAVNTLAGDDVPVDRHALDAPFLHLLDELRVAQGLRLARAGEVVHHSDQYGRDDQPQDQVLCHVVQLATL